MTEQTARILTNAADSIQRNVHCQTHTEAHGKNNAVDHLRALAAEAQPDSANPSVITDRVLSQVLAERIAQDTKWGEQNHRDGTGPDRVWAFTGPASYVADCARDIANELATEGYLSWLDIALEEFAEAAAEADPAKLRAELLQVAAVAVAWIEAIDRRTPAVEACGKCKRPFDPADMSFDSRARHNETPYCRGCVGLCHDSEIADHRCVICA